MSAPDLWLDGNAIAGLLADAVGVEMTRAPRRCRSCGHVSALGAHRLYRGAGLVLRCPVCADVAARIATLPGRHVVLLEGTWRLELPVRPAS